jgi:putative transport protein
MAGACRNAATIASSNNPMQIGRSNITYVIIFPGVTIVNILFVDIVLAFFRR